MYRIDIAINQPKAAGTTLISITAAMSRSASTLESVHRQLVDYALARRARLARIRAGEIALSDVCDADTYLLRAAKFHGQGTDRPCPVCRKEQVTLVSWVFGPKVGGPSGTARSEAEIVELDQQAPEFTVHVVEVCRTCKWNYLVQSYVGGMPQRATKRRRIAK